MQTSSSGRVFSNALSLAFAVPALLGLALALSSCGSGGGAAIPGTGVGSGGVELTSVHYGRLVDVYGLQKTATGTAVVLHERDVLVGADIQDERDSGSAKRDEEILYDFLSTDPDTLQSRLLITRVIGSAEFGAAYDALGAKLRLVAPGLYGQDTQKQPYSVVPRNSGIQLTFSNNLPVDESFFVQRDANGNVVGLLNTEAVQLLRIVGNPNDATSAGDFEVVPARIAIKGNRLILDPVLLGVEGLQYQTRNNASGMPEAPDQVGANIRIALALEGPLRLDGIKPDALNLLIGTNNSGSRSVVRDFRSGNGGDTTAEISQGFVRDPNPPRLVGQIPMYLERVEPRDEFTVYLTLYKGGLTHEFDNGDSVRIVLDNSGSVSVSTDITQNPLEDQGKPAEQHVRVVARKVARISDPDVDPSKKAGYPADPRTPAGEAWLKANAPRAVLIAEFAAEKGLDANSNAYGDDPRYFVTFSPAAATVVDGVPPNQNVSPFAAAIVRFTKPVDLATVRSLDSFFFATRNLLDPVAREAFLTERNIDPNWFRTAKYFTPHLVSAKAFDEDGSQTAIRLQTPLGFYLDEAMRVSDEPLPFEQKKYRYFVHLLSGRDGIKDLSGNPIDFQATTVSESLVIPFSLDTRKTPAGAPLAPDNFAVTIARRLEDVDEDEQPSLYRDDEVQKSATPVNPKAYNVQDVFGAVVLLSDGSMQARPSTRVRKIVDDLNQLPPPSQSTNLRWCPDKVGNENQVATATAGSKFGQGIQNPLNPYGARLQAVWREIDMSLSRVDAFDMNLDVEQLYWAPFTGSPITYDYFDRMSLFLGHSEWRPEPCVGATGALATLASSGLYSNFSANFLFNPGITGTRESGPAPVPAFVDRSLTLDASLAFTEPNGVNRFMPLPKFDKPYFVWRDETVYEQGCSAQTSSDSTNRGANQAGRSMQPYILSPFLGGQGRYVTATGTTLNFNQGTWNSLANYWLDNTSRQDTGTGGLVGSIAAPLLADFWVYPDSSSLPVENPFLATGANGWQISLAVTSGAQPNFRALSAGGLVGGKPTTVDPSKPDWANASGGYTPAGGRTSSADNSVYWIMADFAKRQTVVTSGFVELLDPHRMPTTIVDPRLGPYFGKTLPANLLPRFSYDFEPPLTQLPGGTAVIPEFRGAGELDKLSVPVGQPGMPWRAAEDKYWPNNYPDDQNFPLDPLKAGDAHIRKYDDRKLNGVSRNTWTYTYNRNLTRYVGDPNALMDPRYTATFSGPNETFQPRDVRYFNWRFIMRNNVEATTPISPKIQSFTVTYRFEKTN